MTTSLRVPVADDVPRRPPAPGALELIRQFVNTHDVESGWEGLANPDALATWFAERGMLPAGRELSAQDLAVAIELREVLRRTLEANAGHGDGPAARAALDHLAAHYPLRLRLNGGARLDAEDGAGIAPAVARLLGLVYDAMTLGTWTRLKVCRNDECQWAFYDHSRNRSGAWCTMAICGNRMKGRAFRRRRAGSLSPAG
jgi:predicted RNA-binding Zn ribbon-like protein